MGGGVRFPAGRCCLGSPCAQAGRVRGPVHEVLCPPGFVSTGRTARPVPLSVLTSALSGHWALRVGWGRPRGWLGVTRGPRANGALSPGPAGGAPRVAQHCPPSQSLPWAAGGHERTGTERARARRPLAGRGSWPCVPGLCGQGGAPAPPGGSKRPEQVRQAACRRWGPFVSSAAAESAQPCDAWCHPVSPVTAAEAWGTPWGGEDDT